MLDYASILQAGQGLVPDLQRQMAERQQQALQTQQQQIQLTQLQDKTARQKAYQDAVTQAMLHPTADTMARVALQFPEHADEVKSSFDFYDGPRKKAELTQMSTLYSRMQSGDFKGAGDALRARVEADKAAGHSDPTDQALLDAIDSGDQIQQRAALGQVGITLFQVGGKDFMEWQAKQGDPQSATIKEYNDRVAKFGKAEADKWLAVHDTEIVTPPWGGPVYNKKDFVGGASPAPVTPSNTGGGDPSSSGGGGYAMPVQGRFTSGLGEARDGGTRRHNGQDIAAPLGSPVTPVAGGVVVAIGSDPKSGTFVKVKHPDGRVSSYAHLGGVNVQKGQQIGVGDTLGTVGQTGNATGPVLHLVIRDKDGNVMDPRALLQGANRGDPVQIKSKQQFDRLPVGAEFIAPDGSHRRKS